MFLRSLSETFTLGIYLLGVSRSFAHMNNKEANADTMAGNEAHPTMRHLRGYSASFNSRYDERSEYEAVQSSKFAIAGNNAQGGESRRELPEYQPHVDTRRFEQQENPFTPAINLEQFKNIDPERFTWVNPDEIAPGKVRRCTRNYSSRIL